MNEISEIVQILAALVFGLFVGALLAEGVLFVPYWRTLTAAQFYALHKVFGPRLYRFFAPLTIAATVLVVLAALLSVLTERPGKGALAVTATLALAMIAIYFLYFQPANARFAAADLSPDELARELARWAKWHWVRVVIGIAALVFLLCGIKGLPA